MQIFVLTQKEGSRDIPVSLAGTEADANAWIAQHKDRDYYRFDFEPATENTKLALRPVPVQFVLPPMPTLDPEDPIASFRQVRNYLVDLAERLEEVQRVVAI